MVEYIEIRAKVQYVTSILQFGVVLVYLSLKEYSRKNSSSVKAL